jgi:hypothetical protein
MGVKLFVEKKNWTRQKKHGSSTSSGILSEIINVIK